LLPAGDGESHPVGVASVSIDEYLDQEGGWTAVFREDTKPYRPVVLRGELGDHSTTIMSARDMEEMRYQEEKALMRLQKKEEKAARKALRAEEKALKKAEAAEEKAAKRAKSEHEQASAKNVARRLNQKAFNKTTFGETTHENPLLAAVAGSDEAGGNTFANPMLASLAQEATAAFPSEHRDAPLARMTGGKLGRSARQPGQKPQSLVANPIFGAGSSGEFGSSSEDEDPSLR
jgi:hypothetical protein